MDCLWFASGHEFPYTSCCLLLLCGIHVLVHVSIVLLVGIHTPTHTHTQIPIPLLLLVILTRVKMVAPAQSVKTPRPLTSVPASGGTLEMSAA